MQVFKAALKVFLRHPIYIAIYIIFISFMGMFIGLSVSSETQGTYTAQRPTIAVIDRDGSAFSQGLSDFLADHGNIVQVEDSERALQDATAQDQAAYMVIIPKGFGDDFLAAAEDGAAAPTLDTVVSYESYAGSMMDNLVDEYLRTSRVYVTSGVSDDQAEVASLAAADLAKSAEVTVADTGASSVHSVGYVVYMKYSAYTVMLSIIVCVAVLMAAFNREEVRRRDFAAPTTALSMNVQVALACLVVTLIAWAWTVALGLIVFGGSLAAGNTTAVALAIVSLLVYCVVGLAIGFLIGQLTNSELVMNAAGNIIGLIFSFLGGVWISLDLVGDTVRTIAYVIPTYYYGDAISHAFDLGATGSSTAILADLGILLLFAAAIFAVAFAVGKARRQTTRKLVVASPS